MPRIPSLRHVLDRILFPDRITRRKYISFKALLEEDQRCHQVMAHLERMHKTPGRVDFSRINKHCLELTHALRRMLKHLDHMAPGTYRTLFDRLGDIESSMIRDQEATPSEGPRLLVIGLDEVPPDAEPSVGGKAANLAAATRDSDLRAPRGMVITAQGFMHFMESNHLREPVRQLLSTIDLQDEFSLGEASERLVRLIEDAPLPKELRSAIDAQLEILEAGLAQSSGGRSPSPREPSPSPSPLGGGTRWAIRSSAAAEDSSISFSGQYRSILNVETASVASRYKEVLASKYSPHALHYRISRGLLDDETPMAVLVMEMIDPVSSGVVYSINPDASEPDCIMVYSIWGAGEALVSGEAAPDIFEVSRTEPRYIKRRERHTMHTKLALYPGGGLKPVPLTASERDAFSLDDESVLQLASWAMFLEDRFRSPQDIEWCKGRDAALFLLQSRPLHVAPSTRAENGFTAAVEAPLLLEGGQSAAGGAASGTVFTVLSHSDLQRTPDGAVLVCERPSPDLTQVLEKLSAVVTDRGSAAGHFASIARRHSIPTIVNTGKATSTLRSGDVVTVDANRCRVFQGVVEALTTPHGRAFEDTDRTPFMERLGRILDQVSPLNLTSPESPDFTASNCLTLHDILRFAHEKGIMEMFSLSEERGSKARGARKLVSELPVTLYLLDLGGGIARARPRIKHVTIEEVTSRPFLALWRGLAHPKVDWSARARPMDWRVLERVASGEGVIRLESELLASFAIVSRDYLNLNIRFGFHFAVVDTLCGAAPGESYISFRFEGGGGTPEGRRLRVAFLARVLGASGFHTTVEEDVIAARIREQESDVLLKRLSILGRLLAYTPLMDMKMRDQDDVDRLLRAFMELDENSDGRQ